MERVRAAVVGILVASMLVGGFVLVRMMTRLLWATVRFLETLAVIALAVAVGYLVYRVLAGTSNDPRVLDFDDVSDEAEMLLESVEE